MGIDFQSELNEWREKGLLRSIAPREDRPLINFASNDYLGLSHHPLVIQAAKDALDAIGTGGSSSRLLAGTTRLHDQLEKHLAALLEKEAALVFSSGYHVNTGVIPALVGAGDVVFFDRLSHASIIDGVKLSGAAFATFDHNNAEELESHLRKRRAKGKRALIITEGVFSMDGDRPPLKELAWLAKQWDALLYLDEAHSIGVIGPGGRGVAAEENFLSAIDVHVGTLSKTLGTQGGFVAGARPLIDYLVNKCRSFLYTTALAPACAASALAALKLLPEMEQQRKNLLDSAHDFRERLMKAGYDCLKSRSPIIPVLTGSVEETLAFSRHLLDQGFFVPSIRPPTVPVGQARVRLSLTVPVLRHVEKLRDAFERRTFVQTH